jgi:XTP/dITP diphosphohydrolase
VKTRLLIATNNQNKLAELKRLLDLPDLELLTAHEAGLPYDFDVEETGRTFEENAILKASQYALATGLPALGDDSGLEVPALGGEPGIYSKRYAGDGATDTERINFLLSKMADVPEERSEARFVAAVALAAPNGRILEVKRGICPGRMIREPRGTNGFGYDPIFVPNQANGRTLAELNAAETDAISHRGNAIRAIRASIIILLAEAGK